MKIYQIEAPLKWGDKKVTIKDGSSRIFKYFAINEGKIDFLKFVKPEISLDGITIQKLDNTDFIPNILGVLLVSLKAKKVLESVVGDELEFYQCTISKNDLDVELYIGRINKILEVIDVENSAFIDLGDDKILSKVAFKKNMSDNFFIAKDLKFITVTVVSEKFKELAKLKRLKMQFI